MNVTGTDVGFFLTGTGAELDLGGNADIGLSGRESGALAGFVFFEDPSVPGTPTHYMRGTTLGGFNGAIYLPIGNLLIQGTAGVTLAANDCTVVVANRIEFNGTTSMGLDTSCSNGVSINSNRVFRLVN